MTRAHLVFAVLAALAVPALAPADDRPCGPDSLKGPIRYLIPQAFGRSDFRPSCRTHDDCYSNPNVSKAECDQQFRDRMFAACDGSRLPVVCRTQARVMYASVRFLGDGAHRAAQGNALGR